MALGSLHGADGAGRDALAAGSAGSSTRPARDASTLGLAVADRGDHGAGGAGRLRVRGGDRAGPDADPGARAAGGARPAVRGPDGAGERGEHRAAGGAGRAGGPDRRRAGAAAGRAGGARRGHCQHADWATSAPPLRTPRPNRPPRQPPDHGGHADSQVLLSRSRTHPRRTVHCGWWWWRSWSGRTQSVARRS